MSAQKQAAAGQQATPPAPAPVVTPAPEAGAQASETTDAAGEQRVADAEQTAALATAQAKKADEDRVAAELRAEKAENELKALRRAAAAAINTAAPITTPAPAVVAEVAEVVADPNAETKALCKRYGFAKAWKDQQGNVHFDAEHVKRMDAKTLTEVTVD